MKASEFISARTMQRFNIVMEKSGFTRYDDAGEGAFLMNVLNRYPGYRREIAAALDKARNLKWPDADLEALDGIDIQLANI